MPQQLSFLLSVFAVHFVRSRPSARYCPTLPRPRPPRSRPISERTAYHHHRLPRRARAGGVHDFFSEGDYWWPDPSNPSGPYIQRDGMTNPDNFVEHRQAMFRMCIQVPALASAYKITHDARYAKHAIAHLRAWFIDDATRMNPNLQYAQAIKGVTPAAASALSTRCI